MSIMNKLALLSALSLASIPENDIFLSSKRKVSISTPKVYKSLIPNGVKAFTIEDKVIYAINRKNAERKYEKLKNIGKEAIL